MVATGKASGQLETVLEREERIIAMHSSDVESTLVQFRLTCRRSGRSMYHWSEVGGMVSLKASDISVPGCRKLADALRYVSQSMHYGVYIFTGFEKQLRPPVFDYLLQIARMEDERTVVLLGERIQLPPNLAEHTYHLFESEDEKSSMRPRLRDGRWVV